jgi:hypothetical protein
MRGMVRRNLETREARAFSPEKEVMVLLKFLRSVVVS